MINTFFFWRLLLAHLLADYVFQTNLLAKWKSEKSAGVIVHSLIFFIFSSFFTILDCEPSFGLDFRRLSGLWYILFLLWGTHYLVDQFRILAVKKYGWKDSFIFFVIDQITHVMLIVLVNVVMHYTSHSTLFQGLAPENWTKAASLYITATYFMTIFIFYLEDNGNKIKVISGAEKYYGIIERLLLCVLVSLPGKFYLFIPAVFIGRIYIYRTRRDKFVFDFLNTGLASVIAIGLGLVARIAVFGYPM